MILHLVGIHICYILKQWLRSPYRYSLSAKNEMKILVQMVYFERICTVEADIHVVWDQFNMEGPKGPAFCPDIRKLRGRESWRVTTPHVQSFVLISIHRGQPRTPPSGDNLSVLDYHLKVEPFSIYGSYF